MLQQILVAAIVIGAIAASVWKLMPARRRLQALLALDGWATKHPRFEKWRARSLQPRIARASSAGCGGCAANTSRAHQPPR